MMTTVLETNPNPSVPSTVSAMQDIPLKRIQESKTNPRRQFNEAQLAERKKKSEGEHGNDRKTLKEEVTLPGNRNGPRRQRGPFLFMRPSEVYGYVPPRPSASSPR